MKYSNKRHRPLPMKWSEWLFFIQTPLLMEDESSFRPTRQVMEISERLFTDLGRDGVYRMARARTPDECPHTELPEVRSLSLLLWFKHTYYAFQHCCRLLWWDTAMSGNLLWLKLSSIDAQDYGWKLPAFLYASRVIAKFQSSWKNVFQGHTKTVDYFKVHDGFVLVDMPGYGYRQPQTFATTVAAYLNKRQK